MIFLTSFSDSDTLIESDTEAETKTDSSYSESDCDKDVQIYMKIVLQVLIILMKKKDWIKVFDYDAVQDNSPTVFSPMSPPGPVNCIPEDSPPHEYFLHMFWEDFVDLSVKGTNTQGNNKIQAKETIPKSPRFHKWYHTNQEKLFAFLAVVANMGLVNKKSSLKDYQNPKDWSPFFPAIFTRDRFFILQSILDFPESHGETGKPKKVLHIVKHFSEQFQFYYMPKSKVSIDESLRVFEGPAPAIQYMSNKHHHHFGFKLFSSCESDTGYTVNFSIYERKSNTASEYGISHVCIQLMGPLLGMGYHLYTDN